MSGDAQTRIEPALRRWEPFLDGRAAELPEIVAGLAAIAATVRPDNQSTPPAWHRASTKATEGELRRVAHHAKALAAALDDMHMDTTLALADHGAIVRDPGFRAVLARLADTAKAALEPRVASPAEQAQADTLNRINKAGRALHGTFKPTVDAQHTGPGRKPNVVARTVAKMMFKAFQRLRGENPAHIDQDTAERDGNREFTPVVIEVFRIIGIDADATYYVEEVRKDWQPATSARPGLRSV